MKRHVFLAISGTVASCVGLFALFFPHILLESKGVVDNPAANVWMSETGVLLLAIGSMVLIVRKEPNSLALRSILVAAMIIQLGLLFLELLAYAQDTITKLSGIVPNTILHLFLFLGLGHYLIGMHREAKEGH